MGDVGSCLFCRIAGGKEEASILYQDEYVSAFMDLFPVVPGHLLVIPNMHAALLDELTEDLTARIFSLGRWLGKALRQSTLRAGSIGFYLADGPEAGQVVPHVHLHIIPRFVGDGAALRLHASPPRRAERTRLDSHAAELRAVLLGGAESEGEAKPA